MDRERALRLLRQELPRLETLYAVRTLRLAGSTARGTGSGESDVDVLVDFAKTPTLFTLGRIREDLEEKLGARVDVLTEGGLRRRIRERVLADAIMV